MKPGGVKFHPVQGYEMMQWARDGVPLSSGFSPRWSRLHNGNARLLLLHEVLQCMFRGGGHVKDVLLCHISTYLKRFLRRFKHVAQVLICLMVGLHFSLSGSHFSSHLPMHSARGHVAISLNFE